MTGGARMLSLLAAATQVAAAPEAPRSFAYVLQADALAPSRREAVRRLAGCGRDWIVIDTAFDGGDEGGWTPADVAAVRAGKAGRKVLAYLSVGEAEDYRGYWRREWDADRDGRPDAGAPAWLCGENPDWDGNYRVRYWDEDWQRIALARLDDVVRTGFDGAYLDIVDAFETFEFDPVAGDWTDHRRNPDTGRTFREDMIAWVLRIAARARERRPGFLVVPQNGSQLLEAPAYRGAVDAIGVEDLFTEGDRIRKPSDAEHVRAFLAHAVAAGKPVLAIEYASRSAAVAHAAREAAARGFVLLVTDRGLKTLGASPADAGASGPPMPASPR